MPITRKMIESIENARKRAGYETHQELADAAKLSRPMVTKILNGKKKHIWVSTAVKLAKACNCTLTELLGE